MNSFSDIIKKVDVRFQCLLIVNGAGISPSLPPLTSSVLFYRQNRSIHPIILPIALLI